MGYEYDFEKAVEPLDRDCLRSSNCSNLNSGNSDYYLKIKTLT